MNPNPKVTFWTVFLITLIPSLIMILMIVVAAMTALGQQPAP